MKETGEPDRAGEVLHQAGSTAVSVLTPGGGMHWNVKNHTSGEIVATKALAHIDHWESVHRWELPK